MTHLEKEDILINILKFRELARGDKSREERNTEKYSAQRSRDDKF